MFSLLPMALAAAASAETLVLPMTAPFVAVTINDTPMRLRVAFDAPLPVMLSPQAAARAHLRSLGPAAALVGPIRLAGRSAMADLALGERHRRARVIWMGVAPTDDDDVDGLVSPAALPVATLRMGQAAPTQRTGALAMRVDPASGLAARFTAGTTPVDLSLAPQRAESIATASAGAALIGALGGALAPASLPTRRILFGIDRPVRWLTLGRPLRLGGLSLDRMLVRTRDFAGGARLADESEASSPDEIVVTGSMGKARLRLTLGADTLGRCAAITWQAVTSRIILECP